MGAVRKHREVRDSNIYASCLLVRREQIFLYFASEAGKPLASRVAANGDVLNLAFEGTMEVNLNVADFR